MKEATLVDGRKAFIKGTRVDHYDNSLVIYSLVDEAGETIWNGENLLWPETALSFKVDSPKCEITFTDCTESRQKYEALMKALSATIKTLDKETPWQNHEPKWWLQMMEVEEVVNAKHMHSPILQ